MIDYQEELEQYQERIDELAKEKRYAELRDLFLPMEPADIALLLEEGKQEQMPLLYRLLPKETAAEVFVELEPESQEMLINGFSNTELTEVLDELYLDDAVDIVEEMPASVVIRILDKATPEMRKSINEILKYPEDSAGSIMNMEFLSLKKDMTVEDAFKRIRRIGGELETINILYVTDPTRHLLGVLSVRDLLLAEEARAEYRTLTRQLEGRQDTEKRLKSLVASRFDILDKLGKTYYERENTPSQQAAMFQEVKRIITDFSENSEMLRELEQMADTCHDNVMQKLRQDFPAMKENDIRLLCYIFTGFSPQVISLFTKESVANIYARKSRLKSRIKTAGTPHTDLFLSLFG